MSQSQGRPYVLQCSASSAAGKQDRLRGVHLASPVKKGSMALSATSRRLARAVAPCLTPLAAFVDRRCDRGPGRAEQAIEIARGAGVALLKERGCDDGHWDVEGRDERGRAIEVKIDPRTGGC